VAQSLAQTMSNEWYHETLLLWWRESQRSDLASSALANFTAGGVATVAKGVSMLTNGFSTMAEWYTYYLSLADPRVATWPMMASPWPTLALAATYTAICWRPPKILVGLAGNNGGKVLHLMLAYNVINIVANGIIYFYVSYLKVLKVHKNIRKLIVLSCCMDYKKPFISILL